MKKGIAAYIILVLLSLLILTSCEQSEWPIGRDTVAAWNQGRIQIVRTPDHGFALVVDHENRVSDISVYHRDGSDIYMILYQRVFIRFSLEDESIDTYFSLESITDSHTRTIFSCMLEDKTQ